MLNLLVGSCELTCLKFGVPALTGGKLGLTSGCLCVSMLYKGRLGVFLCIICLHCACALECSDPSIAEV